VQVQRSSRRLEQRLEALGTGVLRLRETGEAQLLTGDWVDQLVVTTPLFHAAVRQQWLTLWKHAGSPVFLWPGVAVVALPGRRRRRMSASPEPEMVAGLILTESLQEAEQFRAVCSHHQCDYRSTLKQLDQRDMLSPGEADRLAMAMYWMNQDLVELERQRGELQNLSSELSESYEELSLLYTLSNNMTVNQKPEAFLRQACEELQQVIGLRWLGLYLYEDDPRLENLSGQMITAEGTQQASSSLKELGRELSREYRELTEPAVFDGATEIDVSRMTGLMDSLLLAPLRTQDNSLGLLVGGEKADGTNITSVDSKLCDSFAKTLAIFLENRMLYEDMHAMFIGTLHALTSAIDAKDSYTHGHTERVAMLARMLAKQVGLDDGTAERVYISGLLHDVGKIGVPEAVLCKAGQLTDDEFELIKMHPQIGARILQDIRQMEDLLPGVLYHHERWDGGGYPKGLSGENIPLFGRLIGLADAFDAMSSTRTYRHAMQMNQVLSEIKQCSGTQFDPDLIEAFLELDFQPFFDMLEKHHARQAG
jgi:HD-GYP domain-containing protein (c-di-GMP phosphodiesterase class II)